MGALLRANPAAGQAFCSYLVSAYLPANHPYALHGHSFHVSVPIEHVLDLAR